MKTHKNKPIEEVYSCGEDAPEWFMNGVNASMTAPTAVNQQKFHFTYKGGNKVKAKALLGPYSKMDLGIAKYHFELGAKNKELEWV